MLTNLRLHRDAQSPFGSYRILLKFLKNEAANSQMLEGILSALEAETGELELGSGNFRIIIPEHAPITTTTRWEDLRKLYYEKHWRRRPMFTFLPQKTINTLVREAGVNDSDITIILSPVELERPARGSERHRQRFGIKAELVIGPPFRAVHPSWVIEQPVELFRNLMLHAYDAFHDNLLSDGARSKEEQGLSQRLRASALAPLSQDAFALRKFVETNANTAVGKFIRECVTKLLESRFIILDGQPGHVESIARLIGRLALCAQFSNLRTDEKGVFDVESLRDLIEEVCKDWPSRVVQFASADACRDYRPEQLYYSVTILRDFRSMLQQGDGLMRMDLKDLYARLTRQKSFLLATTLDDAYSFGTSLPLFNSSAGDGGVGELMTSFPEWAKDTGKITFKLDDDFVKVLNDLHDQSE